MGSSGNGRVGRKGRKRREDSEPSLYENTNLPLGSLHNGPESAARLGIGIGIGVGVGVPTTRLPRRKTKR